MLTWGAVHVSPPLTTSTVTLVYVPVSEFRVPLAQVTEESMDGWRAFTKRYGSNPTALAEVIGLYLATVNGPEPPPLLRRLVKQAIDLEAKRRRRG